MKNLKKEILSIPNIICYCRILLIPIFLYTYFIIEPNKNHILSTTILLISSFSDFLDGYIARKYHMITNIGKLIDPIADKLTQFTVAFVLTYTYSPYIILLIVILIKDFMLLFGGLYVFIKTKRHLPQAEMPGKIATAFFFVISVLLLFFNIPNTIIANIMIYTAIILMSYAMIYYGLRLYKIYKNKKEV